MRKKSALYNDKISHHMLKGGIDMAGYKKGTKRENRARKLNRFYNDLKIAQRSYEMGIIDEEEYRGELRNIAYNNIEAAEIVANRTKH